MRKLTEWERFLRAETKRLEQEKMKREKRELQNREAREKASDDYREFMFRLLLALGVVCAYTALRIYGQLHV